MELAANSQTPTLRSHFLRMARAWAARAASGLNLGVDRKFRQTKQKPK